MSKTDRNIEYEFLPEALEITETPSSPIGRTVIWIITAILVFGLVWAYLGKIDEVATARGKVVPVGDVKSIQAQSGGSVVSIKTKNGDKVKKGQILIELDSNDQKTDLESLRDELATSRFERDLLRAATDGYSLQTVSSDPRVPTETQSDLIKLTQAKISQYQTKEASISSIISQRENRLSVEQEELNKIRERAATIAPDDIGYMSAQSELKVQTDKIADIETGISQAKSDLSSARHDKLSSLMDAVVEHDKTIKNIESRISKAENSVGYQSIESPVDGTVTKMAVSTLGGVVSPAQVLMEVVPEGTPLIIEAALPNKDIGYVSKGQKASIKFDTYSFQKYGMVDGRVESISANAIEQKDQASTYPIEVSFVSKKMKVNGRDSEILPGMTVVAEVKTKNRRVIDFFLDPLIKDVDESLKVR